MKKAIVALVIAVVLLAVGSSAYAHSGRTDSFGGHVDRRFGGYGIKHWH